MYTVDQKFLSVGGLLLINFIASSSERAVLKYSDGTMTHLPNCGMYSDTRTSRFAWCQYSSSVTLTSGVAVGIIHMTFTFEFPSRNSWRMRALCCGALSVIIATFLKCRTSSLMYCRTISLSNLSYVPRNCLPSVAMGSYATTPPPPCRAVPCMEEQSALPSLTSTLLRLQDHL